MKTRETRAAASAHNRVQKTLNIKTREQKTISAHNPCKNHSVWTRQNVETNVNRR